MKKHVILHGSQSETMEKTLVGIHVKGRRFLLVERTEPGEPAATALEGNVLPDELGEIQPLLDLVNNRIAGSGHLAAVFS